MFEYLHSVEHILICMLMGFLYLFQCDVLCTYHIGEIILSLQKTTLIPGGSESLVYTTLSGGIGMLVPFTSHEVSEINSQGLCSIIS